MKVFVFVVIHHTDKLLVLNVNLLTLSYFNICLTKHWLQSDHCYPRLDYILTRQASFEALWSGSHGVLQGLSLGYAVRTPTLAVRDRLAWYIKTCKDEVVYCHLPLASELLEQGRTQLSLVIVFHVAGHPRYCPRCQFSYPRGESVSQQTTSVPGSLIIPNTMSQNQFVGPIQSPDQFV